MSLSDFDSAYDELISRGGFQENDTYYRVSRGRYYRTLRYIAALSLPPKPRLLEVGGGQLAVLASKLLVVDATVGDVEDSCSKQVKSAGVNFTICNLLNDDPPSFQGAFDVIVLAEVIEHLPIPPYVPLRKVRGWLKPRGMLLLTTPNLFRVRNLVRMFLCKDPFDRFMLPRDNLSLGHQIEYSAEHLTWQIQTAGFVEVTVHHDQLGQRGFSWKARFARRLLTPLQLRKKWREGLVAIGRNPEKADH